MTCRQIGHVREILPSRQLCMQDLQKLWPHCRTTGSVKMSEQIGQEISRMKAESTSVCVSSLTVGDDCCSLCEPSLAANHINKILRNITAVIKSWAPQSSSRESYLLLSTETLSVTLNYKQLVRTTQ